MGATRIVPACVDLEHKVETPKPTTGRAPMNVAKPSRQLDIRHSVYLDTVESVVRLIWLQRRCNGDAPGVGGVRSLLLGFSMQLVSRTSSTLLFSMSFFLRPNPILLSPPDNFNLRNLLLCGVGNLSQSAYVTAKEWHRCQLKTK